MKHRGSVATQKILASLPLNDAAFDALDAFAELLLRWNGTVNLITRRDEAELWDRHIVDSLQLIPLLGSPARAIDLGSGGGFPGLILAIATGTPFDLLESDQRKCAFLREAARIAAAPVQLHSVRIENARVLPAPLVTARALAPLPSLLALAGPLLAPGGTCLFLKGANVDAELTAIPAGWQMRTERFSSRTSPSASILRISEIEIVEFPA